MQGCMQISCFITKDLLLLYFGMQTGQDKETLEKALKRYFKTKIGIQIKAETNPIGKTATQLKENYQSNRQILMPEKLDEFI